MHFTTCLRFVFLLLLIPFAFIRCSNDRKRDGTSEKPSQAFQQETIQTPLDTILGDKVLSKNPLKLRRENFHWLIGMSDTVLQHPRVYKVTSMDSTTYLLQYAKSYLTSRRFFLIVRTKSAKIVDYRLFNDYLASPPATVSDGYVILSDCYATDGFDSKINNYMMVVKLDRNLKELWRYAPRKSEKAIVGERIESGKDLVFNTHINEASTVVYHRFTMKLDKKGKCIDAFETGQSNCNATLNRSLVNAVFDIKA